VHAFIPRKFIDHTHPDAILTLTNQHGGAALVREAMGPDVIILDYIKPGFKLARASAAAYEARPDTKAMVWMRHGLVSWGDTARESHRTTIDLVTRAEEYIARRARHTFVVPVPTPLELADARLSRIAPTVRGALARRSGDSDQPFERMILQPLVDRQTLDFVDSQTGKGLASTGPLTSDHLIWTKALPLWIDGACFDDPQAVRIQLSDAIAAYERAYEAYLARNKSRMPADVGRLDPRPRVVFIPGLGAICCGQDVRAARIVRDITAHTIAVKLHAAAMGLYEGMPETDLFDMEYRSFQHAKLGTPPKTPLARHVALITGAAGAIGSGIAQELLEQGCHVAVTDLPGPPLETLVDELAQTHADRVTGVEIDVTDPASVARGFTMVSKTWGGVDLVIANAGLAHVSALAEMQLEAFRRLERVNVEGTLLLLAEAGRHFKLQGTGGDIVLVSTKNVFAPGAKFGAYSATKSAAHQLARIASLELAEYGVRVNMVSPDAVFSNDSRRSGLWAEVGPDRMKARGLDSQGLEDYYQNRNLLKARVTARHVAKAVLFFATRQTPTTGATIPVDGGLPDSTPR
jgi:rhamnose utilization protein RhaD (predicted bifunctional aldolase and dehydrogenase)/NAD(P)-dependent dehydrogenase (short-subunit alcohol dehydrogenase family)